eukprot:Skav230430  [mRNA]  locus=scaffold1601:116681:117193:+ [translate_table: standard]
MESQCIITRARCFHAHHRQFAPRSRLPRDQQGSPQWIRQDEAPICNLWPRPHTWDSPMCEVWARSYQVEEGAGVACPTAAREQRPRAVEDGFAGSPTGGRSATRQATYCIPVISDAADGINILDVATPITQGSGNQLPRRERNSLACVMSCCVLRMGRCKACGRPQTPRS